MLSGPKFPSLPQAARDLGWENALEVSPVTGRQRLIPAHNDVFGVIEKMGGSLAAATALGVEEWEVEIWVDGHYVPTRYARQIKKLTGWSLWSMQKPPFDVNASVGAAE